MNPNCTIKIKYIIGSLIFSLGNFVNAQTPISLEKAIEKSYENNLFIKDAQLKSKYQEKIKKSYAVVDPLQVAGEFGQFNSDKMDNKISVNQNFRLPGFYKKQKQVFLEEWKNANLNIDLQKLALKKNISLIYNELKYQEEKKKLLTKVDSIYSTYYKKADLRLKKGESNLLEKTTAENYRAQANLQLNSLSQDRAYTLAQFNNLIQDNVDYTNENGGYPEISLWKNEGKFLGNPIVLQQLEQQKNIEKAKLEAEKSKLLPTFNLGINSMTIAGNSGNNNQRYQSGMIGIAVPLFNTAQKSVIEGQKINQEIAENNYNIQLKNMENYYSKLVSEYKKIKTEQDYYEAKGLKNAEIILNTANKQFYEGEINYLEWSILVNQSLEISSKYIDNQKILNEKIIELNNLSAK
jgi:outer membrane protein TolC